MLFSLNQNLALPHLNEDQIPLYFNKNEVLANYN
jgi:hypothetical protein